MISCIGEEAEASLERDMAMEEFLEFEEPHCIDYSPEEDCDD